MMSFRHTGKSQEDLVRQVCAWFLGNPKTHVRGKTITELLTLTGKKSRQTIYDYLDKGISLGIDGISKDASGSYLRTEITT